MSRRRLAAIASLAVAAAVVVFAVAEAIATFPNGISVLACVVVAALAGGYGLVRRDAPRLIGFVVAGLALAGAVVLVVVESALLPNLLIVVGALLSIGAAREAFYARVELPRAPAPRHAVLFFNPLSGGGKAKRWNLAEEARDRGIEPIELRRGDDLWKLVRDAVAGGADGLAMAGGDGSQAIVAAIAAEHGLPYACVPAGTRNHFALDLGVDRDDVVGGLDAFVDGGERLVDLAEVNERVFVNNVSLGLYAKAVQREGYREAKIRTLLDTVPETLGPDADPPDLRWRGVGGREHRTGAAILVSNNRYRLGHAIASGMRPRMDEGVLGITVIGAPPERGAAPRRVRSPWREWTSPRFAVDADGPIAAGIDGESAMLDPPLRFRIRRRVLRARVARQHPGASPAAGAPNGAEDAIRRLVRIAAGRDHDGAASPRPRPPREET